MGFWESKVDRVNRGFTKKDITVKSHHTIKNLAVQEQSKKVKKYLDGSFSLQYEDRN